MAWSPLSTSYIDAMAHRAHTGFAKLFDGVERVTFTDFPEGPNVGDTAIALGTLKFFESANIQVLGIYCIATLSKKVFDSVDPVYINGGGNIGLYAHCDRHRFRIAEGLRAGTKIIQGPQSINFASEAQRFAFVQRFGSRNDVVIAARDEPSRQLLGSLGLRSEIALVPDAVHLLGAIDAPAPTVKTVFLTRKDAEAADSQAIRAVDWPHEEWLKRTACDLRWRSEPWPVLARALNPSIRGWRRIADLRLKRGVAVLAPAETVVTDRLHAMLIALQMGRSVIAVDNNNRKLSKYSETWFGATSPDVRFANSFADAQRMLR
jgi:exopolysaccharide biosynthesis predicted pyruvyltransferase EpsI